MKHTVPPGGAGSDTTAIHDDTAGEIAAVTAKATPTTSDFLLIEDAAAANVKKSITIGNLPPTAPTAADVVTALASAASSIDVNGQEVVNAAGFANHAGARTFAVEASGSGNDSSIITINGAASGGIWNGSSSSTFGSVSSHDTRIARAGSTVAKFSATAFIPTALGQGRRRVAHGAGNSSITTTTGLVAITGVTSGGDTKTLPDASTVETGQEIVISDESGSVSGTDTITIDVSGGGTIGGASSKTFTAARFSATVHSDGTNWHVR